jgi:hypothetical protein
MKRFCRLIITSSTILGLFVASLAANAQIPPPKDPSDMLSGSYTGTSYSPYAGRNFPIRSTPGHSVPGLLLRMRIDSHAETRSLHPPVLR